MIDIPPLVSVIMAVHRRDIFFEDALGSILTQSLSNFEFIIVANAVSDDDFSYFLKLANLDRRIRLLRIVLPGLANALNYGVCNARAEFIARMDADDISLSNRLELQYIALLENRNLTIVGCRADLINENGSVIGEFPYFFSDSEIRRVLPYRNPLLHPALMMRKSALVQVGGYRYGHMSEDHELFIRLARDKKYLFQNLPEKVFLYRRHENQITSVRYAKKHYAEISGFLTTEFLLTHNPLYIIGSIAIHPWVRACRNWFKRVISNHFDQ